MLFKNNNKRYYIPFDYPKIHIGNIMYNVLINLLVYRKVNKLLYVIQCRVGVGSIDTLLHNSYYTH